MRLRWTNVPIPDAHLAALLVGLVLHLVAPARLLRRARAGRALGVPLLGAGLLLAGWAVATFEEVDSAAPSQLITTGPYAHSRNPMYVAWTLIVMGLALVANTAWVWGFLAAALGYTHYRVIPCEEQQLAAQFGDEYRHYRARVRRYV